MFAQIIDGEVAFTGGAGIADHWRGNATEPDEWRDMQTERQPFAHNEESNVCFFDRGWRSSCTRPFSTISNHLSN